jgi:hypothetical protein
LSQGGLAAEYCSETLKNAFGKIGSLLVQLQLRAILNVREKRKPFIRNELKCSTSPARTFQSHMRASTLQVTAPESERERPGRK